MIKTLPKLMCAILMIFGAMLFGWMSAYANERTYEVSPSGSVRYDKPSYVTKTQSNGIKRTYEVSPSGSVRYDKPSLVTKPAKKK